jgi:hypothetical protein
VLRAISLEGRGEEAITPVLRARGLAPDQPVAMMLPTGLDYFSTF